MGEAGEGGLGAVLRATGNDMVIPRGPSVVSPLRAAGVASRLRWLGEVWWRGVSKRKGCKGRKLWLHNSMVDG